MTTHTLAPSVPTSNDTRGMLLGLIGVAIFSLTLPFTRLAVGGTDFAPNGLSPMFVALARALGAAVLAGAWLFWQRAPLPPRSAWRPLALVALGCVIGFPWLTSVAMRTLPAVHGAVLVGILPLATAVFAALLGGEKPSRGFWIMALVGSALVAGFALRQGGGGLHAADVAIFAAVLLAAMGYAAGGRLSQTLGGQQTICWALVLSAPLLLPVVAWLCWRDAVQIAAADPAAWAGFAYTCVFSMFIGFFFWYRGMALGGVARVGQVQLVQPFLSLLGAAVFLGEALDWQTVVFAIAVIAVVGVGRKMGVKRR
ncbi:UNVERIFIED_ORG: EamA-like transporter family protein [Zoogloea ramigera]|uniref:DMT family transporter n=1 Tax=Duganella zoogloeoides TaxID=75659 RepID=A0ABZ0XUH4_9BURK|nr:DMT family transporter [Duganella zoogloeoides]WQH02810.1 DMT family transporter [Duganella zoogloeoides]